MNHYTLEREDAFCFAIDIQPRLVAALSRGDAVIKNTHVLLSAAKAYDMPAVYTEQYPKGLGTTEETLRIILQDIAEGYAAKTGFNAMVPEIREAVAALKAQGRTKAIVSGAETHICVYQTVCDLLAEGFDVFLPYDAIDSRDPENARAGLSMMQAMGAKLTTTETVLFELMHDSKDPHFKELQAFIK
ncbi:MAG: isochorismatase family protein [Peptoniphilaceae bacterium]|nr:isochorismatase family protein [Peptoniphilaceae bacterium]MDY6086060.1 isochorismatase family protein [Peptoniphilaceae bacterium]